MPPAGELRASDDFFRHLVFSSPFSAGLSRHPKGVSAPFLQGPPDTQVVGPHTLQNPHGIPKGGPPISAESSRHPERWAAPLCGALSLPRRGSKGLCKAPSNSQSKVQLSLRNLLDTPGRGPAISAKPSRHPQGVPHLSLQSHIDTPERGLAISAKPSGTSRAHARIFAKTPSAPQGVRGGSLQRRSCGPERLTEAFARTSRRPRASPLHPDPW